ncbi:unnamed protein product [Phytomonas sp. EM1]|nr:unnamed protein product [Phytomonas sp. EM1]|eukprot:CCW60069.1 unnamed protein product [Phytomonas sp. isolate EM1]
MEILKKTAAFRIQKQVEGLQSSEVTDISLSGVPFLPELFTPYKNLVHLTLVFLKPKLKSLESIPFSCFPSLRLLNLSDNAVTIPNVLAVELEELKGTAEQVNLGGSTTNNVDASTAKGVFTECKLCPLVSSSLKRLLLPNNCITDMEEVQRLAVSFPEIEVLDLFDNPVDTPSHFSAIFGLFPKLVALDSKDNEGCEVVVEDSDETSNDDISEESEDSSEEDSDDADEEDDVSDNRSGDSNGSLTRKRPRLQ